MPIDHASRNPQEVPVFHAVRKREVAVTGVLVYPARPSERWMSGLSRTPGKRVWDNIPTGVRIPPSPPNFFIIQGHFDLNEFTPIV